MHKLQGKRHKPQLPRKPQLPKEDIKIALRSRDGLNITKLSAAKIRDGVLRAAAVKIEDAEEDLWCLSSTQNIIVVSPPKMENVEKYNAIRELRFGEKSYETTAYAPPPEDTATGVIHNIPDYDTDEDISRSLVYKKNPTILQARGMGKTNSAIIVFEGNKVPYFVYYRGADRKAKGCTLYEKLDFGLHLDEDEQPSSLRTPSEKPHPVPAKQVNLETLRICVSDCFGLQ